MILRGKISLLLACCMSILLVSERAKAELYVYYSYNSSIDIIPESLHFQTGRAGDVVTVSANQFTSVIGTAVSQSTNPTPECRSNLANFYATYVTHLPAGSEPGWFRLTDVLEFTMYDPGNGNATLNGDYSVTYGESNTYTLCGNGYSKSSEAPWSPWVKRLVFKFRLLKDAIDTPTYIPPLYLIDYRGIYDSSRNASTAELTRFISSAPAPLWRFNTRAGYLSIPDAKCKVTPNNLTVDFGDITSSQIEKINLKENLSVSCNETVTLKLKIEGVNSSTSGTGVDLKTNRDNLLARVNLDRTADSLGYFKGYKVNAGTALNIPMDFELKKTGTVSPGQLVSNAWLILTHD
ncbi:hypothetical protein E0G79_21810 [Salmonella enterica]|nr:hypothetical protein [Salmonella enterica]EBA9765174.1 hypothetical protein [Salmonella enterica]EEB5698910.1 hypothetical protein [Salmonella enterica]EHQ9355016.1 hypothetical protein [Salmonella enterica]EHR1671009.1 hypothetical protein [Salmonella enterica]